MVGIRSAISLIFLSLFFWNFLLAAVLGPDATFALLAALAAVYGVAFFGVAAQWFWARWFAIGLGNFGTISLLSLLNNEADPSIIIFGGSHLLISLSLAGEGMAARFERSEAAAERWNFQEESLMLMRRAIRSAGMLLPLLILYTLAPPAEPTRVVVFALAAFGTWGLLRNRTWGLLGLMGAGVLAAIDAVRLWNHPSAVFGFQYSADAPLYQLWDVHLAMASAAIVLVPVLFLPAMYRWLRQR